MTSLCCHAALCSLFLSFVLTITARPFLSNYERQGDVQKPLIVGSNTASPGESDLVADPDQHLDDRDSLEDFVFGGPPTPPQKKSRRTVIDDGDFVP